MEFPAGEPSVQTTPEKPEPLPDGSAEPSRGSDSSAEADDAALARALAARGVPPEEIQRLLSLGSGSAAGPTPAREGRSPSPAPAAPSFKPRPSIKFPEFRDSSPEETERAEQLLRQAAIARRRGRIEESARLCEEAIRLCPRDAGALELFGDLLQYLGRVDDALAAYHRATEADPRRGSAEKKYAELLLMQDRSVYGARAADEPRNPYLAVLLSALCPGAGQLYNGQIAKAVILACMAFALAVLILWTPLGFAGPDNGLTASAVTLMALFGAVYVYSIADANFSARAGNDASAGWDV